MAREAPRYQSTEFGTPPVDSMQSCACSGCHSELGNELYSFHQNSINPYFSHAQYSPVVVPSTSSYAAYGSATSTPHDFLESSTPHFYPSQTSPYGSIQPPFKPQLQHQFGSPSGTTTPMLTPPTQSPWHFSTATTSDAELYSAPAEPPRALQGFDAHRQYTPNGLSSPTVPLSDEFLFESSSVGQPIPLPIPPTPTPATPATTSGGRGSLAPPIVLSKSFDETALLGDTGRGGRPSMRSRENSGSSLGGRGGGAPFRRRSSTLSVTSMPEGPNSDTSDGAGESFDRHETITPFVSKLAYLLREDTPWIRWNTEGTAFFFAHHRDEFGDQLSRVFRHGSSHSFVRQLNIYNFKRLSPAELEQTVSEVGPLARGLVPNDFAAFAHPLFFRDDACDLTRIKPKAPRKVSSKLSLRATTSLGTSPSHPAHQQAPSPRSLRTEGKTGGSVRPRY
ncbi:hypothetical protein JCM3766R1_006961 [Sporobolomyces carnicolor]